MKNLADYIEESLIKLYDTEKLKSVLKKKYDIIDFHDFETKSDKPNRFVMTVSLETYEKLETDEGFEKLIDLCGYVPTEVRLANEEGNIIDIHLEPNFGKKCNSLVYDKCDGIIWHVSRKKYKNAINDKGLIPFIGEKYRRFTERVFLSCGETSQEIIDNIQFLIEQLRLKEGDYIIYKIDLKRNKKHPYNVNFYYDPAEDNVHNFIYANAVFFPHLFVNEFESIDELRDDLKKIDENLVLRKR